MTPVYLDGRPRPSKYASHTWSGFSTGEWIGNTLKITTTHVKDGYIRRSVLYRSDKATLIQYLTSRSDILTWTIITYDPVYLTEPLIRTKEYRLTPTQQIPPYPCTVVTEVERPKGVVPHYLPGTNQELTAYANYYKIPYEASKGGAETMYPEYQKKLKQMTATVRSSSQAKPSTSWGLLRHEVPLICFVRRRVIAPCARSVPRARPRWRAAGRSGSAACKSRRRYRESLSPTGKSLA